MRQVCGDMMTDQPTDTEVREWLDAAARHDAMMDAARERWPEMVEEPAIRAVQPGANRVEVMIYEPIAPVDQADVLAERPPYKKERIFLEPIGPYLMGYGSGVLYVGQEHRVTFAESVTVWQSRPLDTSGGGSPFVKLSDD